MLRLFHSIPHETLEEKFNSQVLLKDHLNPTYSTSRQLRGARDVVQQNTKNVK